jgi:hypothetical protein
MSKSANAACVTLCACFLPYTRHCNNKRETHTRVIKVLCELGKDDRPVGTMSLVLEIIAEMLTKIRLVPTKIKLCIDVMLHGAFTTSK